MEIIYLDTDFCTTKTGTKEKEYIFTHKDIYIFLESVKYTEVQEGKLYIFYKDGKNQGFILNDIKNEEEGKHYGWGYIRNYNEVLEILKLKRLKVWKKF